MDFDFSKNKSRETANVSWYSTSSDTQNHLYLLLRAHTLNELVVSSTAHKCLGFNVVFTFEVSVLPGGLFPGTTFQFVHDNLNLQE